MHDYSVLKRQLSTLGVPALRAALRSAFGAKPDAFPHLKAQAKPGVAIAKASTSDLFDYISTNTGAVEVMRHHDTWRAAKGIPLKFQAYTESKDEGEWKREDKRDDRDKSRRPMPMIGDKIRLTKACTYGKVGEAYEVVKDDYANPTFAKTYGMSFRISIPDYGNAIFIAHEKGCEWEIVETQHKQEEEEPEVEPKTQSTDPRIAALMDLLGGGSVDYDRIKAMVKKEIEHISDPKAIVVTLTKGSETKTIPGLQHKQFPALLRALDAKQHVALIGPAGTGKTHAAEQVAEALSLPFHAVSVGPMTTQAQFSGFMNAEGKFVDTEFRRAFEKGGLFLLDEADAASPAVLLALNAATANGWAAFADGMVKKHDTFRLVLGMNTWGRGADAQYRGRQAFDQAFLDRLVKLEWPYDEGMELKLCPYKAWAKYIHRLRKEINKAGLSLVISGRAILNGAALIQAGFTPTEARDMYLGYQGLDAKAREIVDRIELPIIKTDEDSEAA